MSQSLRRRALDYLEGHSVMSLATSGPQGPWAAAVFYASEDFRLFFLSAASTRHAGNLAAHPGVAATIQEECADWVAIKGVQLEGTARLLEGRERKAARQRYGVKFPYVGSSVAEPLARVLSKVDWYELRPSRLYLIDNSLGLGHRDEVPLMRS